MNQLMIYVEGIVKPIAATQSRKLRMRADLLAHLESALEEERLFDPGDEAGALERAKFRLGKPTELTRQLQQTVPAVESTLLGRLSLPPRIDELEQRMAYVPGQRGAMTMGHKTLLSAMATLSATPLFLSMHSALASVDMEAVHPALSTAGTFVGCLVLLLCSYRFVFAAANSEESFDWPGAMKRGGVILALQLGMAFFLAATIADRAATSREVLNCVTLALAFLIGSGLIARWISVLRRPYDEWLKLDIAR